MLAAFFFVAIFFLAGAFLGLFSLLALGNPPFQSAEAVCEQLVNNFTFIESLIVTVFLSNIFRAHPKLFSAMRAPICFFSRAKVFSGSPFRKKISELVLVRIHSDVCAADIIRDHQIAIFLRQLARGVRFQLLRFGRETDDKTIMRHYSLGWRECRASAQARGKTVRAAFGHFLRRVMRGFVVANRGAHHEHVALRELRGDGSEHFLARCHSHDFRAATAG